MFISPRIVTLIENDSTTDEYVLEQTDSQSFTILEHLISGEPIHPHGEAIESLINLIDDLANIELSELVINFIESEMELTVSNCNSRLKRRMRLNITIE
jgi:hypothetical protein